MRKVKNACCVVVFALLLAISATVNPASAADKAVRERAAMVISASESFAQAARASYRRTGTVAGDINDLVGGGYLPAYPKISHPQSDFYNALSVIEEGVEAAYFLRYSFAEPDAEEVCKVINESKLDLRPGSPVSGTSLKQSTVYPHALAFSPPPVEVVGKEAFCIKIDDNFEYFQRVMPVSP